ncbi:hypothetical protein FRB90_002132 [Tulasnella sp. 427]|nr:hypothetical protein FRB90_002132 [Tulasnella sp. 427]
MKANQDVIMEKDINPYRFPQEPIGWLSLRTVESRFPRGKKANIRALEIELLALEVAAVESHEQQDAMSKPIEGGIDQVVLERPPQEDDEISYDSRAAEEYTREMEEHLNGEHLNHSHNSAPESKTMSERSSEPDTRPRIPVSERSLSYANDFLRDWNLSSSSRNPKLASEIIGSDDSSTSEQDAGPRQRLESLSLDDPTVNEEDGFREPTEEDRLHGAIEPEKTRRPCGEARFLVQRDWDRATDEADSARIEIADNEVDDNDDEDCPNLPMGFKYMERGYELDRSVTRFVPRRSLDPTSGLGCHCDVACDVEQPASCACQSYSEYNDHFAYNRQRLFLDNNKDENGADAEVFECTSGCHCEPDCPNRTSQQPRDVPLQVFKTEQSGWAVRTTCDLPPGKVLGMFAGTLITRERAEALEKSRRLEWARHNDPENKRRQRLVLDRRGYIFDLDCREAQQDVPAFDDPPSSPNRPRANRKRYSIDAWRCGNWTRFINPNMKVYTAYHDPYDPEDPPPGKLIFVTTDDVLAGDELTIDYEPGASALGRGKQRKTRPKGNLNVSEMSQRQYAGAQKAPVQGDMAAASSKTVNDGSQPDLIACKCVASRHDCRGFIKI